MTKSGAVDELRVEMLVRVEAENVSAKSKGVSVDATSDPLGGPKEHVSGSTVKISTFRNLSASTTPAKGSGKLSPN